MNESTTAATTEPAAKATTAENQTQVCTLGGGCFWCTEAVFVELRGVHKVVSGYAGGATANPTYQQICTGTTGHAEVIQITFDPAEISFTDILNVFFTTHDPTTLNRQGADVGTQYRSVIYYHDEAQKATAEQVIADINGQGIWPNPIVTEVSPAPPFYEAEQYHQDYFLNNPNQGYCQFVIVPKVAKFRKDHFDKLKK